MKVIRQHLQFKEAVGGARLHVDVGRGVLSKVVVSGHGRRFHLLKHAA